MKLITNFKNFRPYCNLQNKTQTRATDGQIYGVSLPLYVHILYWRSSSRKSASASLTLPPSQAARKL